LRQAFLKKEISHVPIQGDVVRVSNLSSKPTPTGWAKIKEAAGYASVSIQTIRNWLKKGLRHSRVGTGGAILIKLEWLDEFLESHEVNVESEKAKIDAIVDSVLKDFGKV
jgi:excisionase family DNA binding protein